MKIYYPHPKSYIHQIEPYSEVFNYLTSMPHSEHMQNFFAKWLGEGYFNILMMKRKIQPRTINMMDTQDAVMPPMSDEYCLPSIPCQRSSYLNRGSYE